MEKRLLRPFLVDPAGLHEIGPVGKPQGLADVGKGFVYLSQKQGNPDKYKEFSTQNLSELDPIERGDPRSKPRPPKQVNPLLMFGAAAAAYFYFKGK